jgi:hypothetical protein
MSTGRVTSFVFVIIVAAAAGVWFLRRQTVVAPQRAVYVCSETLKPFDYELKVGDTIPVLSPYTGRQTGYPAEMCSWTKDGTVKERPTAVLLNSFAGKPEPTFCPDCGRLVVPHNPAPQAGAAPPVTKDKYATSAPTTERTSR